MNPFFSSNRGNPRNWEHDNISSPNSSPFNFPCAMVRSASGTNYPRDENVIHL